MDPRSIRIGREDVPVPSWPKLPRRIRSEADLARLTEVLVDHERGRRVARGARPFDLRAMRALDSALGHPHRAFRVFHVAGSKGKGSVCAFLDALLRTHGARVGLYLSPHVDHWGERVRIDGADARPAELGRAVDRVLATAREAGLPAPTFFEVLTAAAFLRFVEAGVEVAVLETGLGGRLDATNVVRSDCAVITAIEREHCAILGRTLCEIAREKAGILERGRPAVLGVPRSHPAGSFLRQRAEELGTTPWQWGAEIRLRRVRGTATLHLPDREPVCLPEAPLGPHGERNLCLALAAASRFEARHRDFPGLGGDGARLEEACERVRLPARAEVLAQAPKVIRDGAHTPRSIGSLVEWLVRREPGPPPVLVLGMLEDKDPIACLRPLVSSIGPVIATEVPGGRSYPFEKLAEGARALGLRAEGLRSLAEALREARRLAGREGRVLVTGSFWLAGAVPAALRTLDVPHSLSTNR